MKRRSRFKVPVSTEPRYPGAGGRLSIRVSATGEGSTLVATHDTPVNPRLGAVVARVTGALLAGARFPVAVDMTHDCWIRESRDDLLKVDVDDTTIVCAATVDGEHVRRLLNAIANMHRLAELQSDAVTFVPIVKAGWSEYAVYYVEAFALPELIVPSLISDSVRFVQYLVVDPDSPCEIHDRDAYVESLCRGEDPDGWVSFEPYLGSLLSGMTEVQSREFIAQVGSVVRSVADGRAEI